MKKVMYVLLGLIISVGIARVSDARGLIVMVIVLLTLVTALIVMNLTILINIERARQHIAEFEELEQSYRKARSYQRFPLSPHQAVISAELVMASYHLLIGNLEAFEEIIDGLNVNDMRSKKQLVDYLSLKKDYYFIVDDREKYQKVIDFIKANLNGLADEFKNDIASDLFIFDLRDGFVDYKHEEQMLDYLKSFASQNRLHECTYLYTVALISKCRHQDYTLTELKKKAHGTFFTLLLKDFD